MIGAALLLTKEIARYRPMLYRLALLQLRHKAAADDATQETLLAALEGIERFRSPNAAYARARASNLQRCSRRSEPISRAKRRIPSHKDHASQEAQGLLSIADLHLCLSFAGWRAHAVRDRPEPK
jgi:DNA-directed RNA polymerase specialized sigma24 family protein